MTEKEKTYHWDPEQRSIGVCVEWVYPKNGGEPFLSYETMRSYRIDGEERNRYSHRFTLRQIAAKDRVENWARQYMIERELGSEDHIPSNSDEAPVDEFDEASVNELDEAA